MTELLVASNRGPLSFRVHDGQLTAQRGGGGLVSGLASVSATTDVLWVCAALSDTDRQAASQAPGGYLEKAGYDTGGASVRMLDIPPDTFDRAYNVVANSVLWFVHHMLYDTPRRPEFDRAFRGDWQAYVEYNTAYADALAETAAPGAKVLVQDYHLALVPRLLRERRADLRIAHFTHTPWAPPEYFRMLPDDVATELLTGILGADHAGFLSPRWASAFVDCCADVLGAAVTSDTVGLADRTTRCGVHALGADGEFLAERANADDVETRMQAIRAKAGDRQLIVRVDRTELSKNILRGLAAYRELLRERPQWRGKVVHVAFAYPSRYGLPEYRDYAAAVEELAAEIQDEFGTDDWQPLLLQVDDDFARSLAAYRLADVLLVNPIRDGMNLVAKEGPVLADHGVTLVLSREAGAYDELGDDAIAVNPYDVSGTAQALHEALSMPADERAKRCRRLAEAATGLPPAQWFADQVAALD
ncbi:MAG: trehalose-6-phosphate synthase [Streptosporangiales bacterium]|nr:trehalose-6-phosphate synthase [Streptosporangiales bacterium]